jgi:serine/threonine protein kinase
MRRLALELLVDPELEKKAKEIFASHAHGKRSLQFSDYLTMLHSLHNKFGLPEPNAESAKRIFHRFNHESNLIFDDFFDLLKALLRRNAFDHSTTLSREFFINKRSDGDKIWTVYDKIRQLGEGSFGTAHLVKRIDNSEERVVKVVAKSRSNLPVEEIEQEILILRQVDHPHVVRLFEWYEDASSIYLVIEALKGGTLQEVILLQQKRKQGLHENWTRKVVGQVADAMCYCHGLRLIHKDLKDENVMLLRRDPSFEDPFAVVIDLGVAEMFSLADPAGREIGGSPTTMAPEVWSGTFGPKCDVWSLGCIFFELLSGSLPFLANTIQPSVWLRLAKRGPNWGLVKTCPLGKALCKSMLAYAVGERMTMEAVARHEYFKVALPELKAVPSEQFQSFATFCEQTKMKRALLLEMSARMPISKSQEIIKLFESLDKDRNGTIGESELKALFHKMGVDDDDDLVSRTFQALDADSDGSLTFSEFASGALLLFKDSLEENFRSLFLNHDRHRDGYLDVAEARQFLRDVAAAMNPNGDNEGVEDSLLEEVLASGDGHKIKYEQLRDAVVPQRTA